MDPGTENKSIITQHDPKWLFYWMLYLSRRRREGEGEGEGGRGRGRGEEEKGEQRGGKGGRERGREGEGEGKGRESERERKERERERERAFNSEKQQRDSPPGHSQRRILHQPVSGRWCVSGETDRETFLSGNPLADQCPSRTLTEVRGQEIM